MALVREVITGAYSRLNLLAGRSTLDPDRAAEGLEAFNDLVAELALDGIFPAGPNAPQARYPEPAQNTFLPHGPDNEVSPALQSSGPYGLNDAFPFPAQFVGGFKSMLAMYIADVGSGNPTPNLAKRAADAKRSMLSFYVTAPLANIDPAIARSPSQRRNWDSVTNGDSINDTGSGFPTRAGVVPTPTEVDIFFD